MASYTLEFGLVDSVCFVITTVLVWRWREWGTLGTTMYLPFIFHYFLLSRGSFSRSVDGALHSWPSWFWGQFGGTPAYYMLFAGTNSLFLCLGGNVVFPWAWLAISIYQQWAARDSHVIHGLFLYDYEHDSRRFSWSDASCVYLMPAAFIMVAVLATATAAIFAPIPRSRSALKRESVTVIGPFAMAFLALAAQNKLFSTSWMDGGSRIVSIVSATLVIWGFALIFHGCYVLIHSILMTSPRAYLIQVLWPSRSGAVAAGSIAIPVVATPRSNAVGTNPLEEAWIGKTKTWIIQNEGSASNVAISREVACFIPAHYVFGPGTGWKILPLKDPWTGACNGQLPELFAGLTRSNLFITEDHE